MTITGPSPTAESFLEEQSPIGVDRPRAPTRLGPRRRLAENMREFLYGLDIETDTTVDGLDPAVARVVAVGVSTPFGERVFEGEEDRILVELDSWLGELSAGVIVTWNGSSFDLPYLQERSRTLGLRLGLLICGDPSIPLRGRVAGGHQHAFRGVWHQHQHLDAYRLYKGDVGPLLKVSCALKSIARLVGLPTTDVDQRRIHELPAGEVAKYVTSDARLARQLVLRRWETARRFVDPVPYAGL